MKCFAQLIWMVLVCYATNGQALKTYNGPYLNGKATYQYFEDSKGERILHGPFRYSHGYLYGAKKHGYVATGSFLQGKREGFWKVSYNDYYHAVEVATANYKSGMLSGPCSYTSSSFTTKAVISTNTAQFYNNKIVGVFKYQSRRTPGFDADNESIIANFDSSGCLNGKLTINYEVHGISFLDISEYKSGFLYSRYSKDISTGKIDFVPVSVDSLTKTLPSNFPDTLTIRVSSAKFALSNIPLIIPQDESDNPRTDPWYEDYIIESASDKHEATSLYRNANVRLIRCRLSMGFKFGGKPPIHILESWAGTTNEDGDNLFSTIASVPGAAKVVFVPTRAFAISEAEAEKLKKEHDSLLEETHVRIRVEELRLEKERREKASGK